MRHSLPRLLRTLWYLRPEQWVGQVRRRLGTPGGPVRAGGSPPRLRFTEPAVPWLGAPSHASCDGRAIELLRRRLPIGEDGCIDWDYAGEGPLFAYHLHQFDWARSAGCPAQVRLAAMVDWLERHRVGVGWEPAPASLRLFAWIKLLTTPGALPPDEALRGRLLASLADHAATVAARPERHLLANHYLWNLLALVLAGLALEGGPADRALAFRDLLLAELEEQILPDGAHVERSPMYHALILENVLDLLNAARAARGRAGAPLEEALEDAAARMLGALAVWTHPDGEIALFGDAAFGIAHDPAALRAYGAELGVAPRGPRRPGVLDAAGFARLEVGPMRVLVSAGGPMPAYQPGHAHCDALSFELSVGACRVVTDTGVTEYVRGPLRQLSRATSSHATIEVEGHEQAEIWAAHRIGGRPDVGLVRVEPGRLVEGVCAGWATPEILHRRCFEAEGEALAIRDRLDRPARSARLFLPLAPGLEPVLDGGVARVAVPGEGLLEVSLPNTARFRVERAPYFPEFGHRVERAALVGEAQPLARADWCIRALRR